MIRKIKERCPLCNLPMSEEDYLQLACTHRFHQECAKKMQWRMRYNCDICEIKKESNGSILRIKGKRHYPVQNNNLPD